MSSVTIEIFLILALILLNGLFSMAEMAIVSAKKVRLQQQIEEGDVGAKNALALALNPNRFLSTVQVGITLIGILNGALGGATLADEVASLAAKVPWLAPYSRGLGVVVVVLIITYFSLVLGELVPKRIALNNAEGVASSLSSLMQFLSRLAVPFVGVLSVSTDFVLRTIGIRPSRGPDITEEDIRGLINEGREEGVFEEAEQDMVEGVFQLSERRVSQLMTPRTEVHFLEINASDDEVVSETTQSGYSRYPLVQDDLDDILGIIYVKDLYNQQVKNLPIHLDELMKPALFVPETMLALELLGEFRRTGAELALVIDEYGGFMGLVSLHDVLEAIVGEIKISPASDEAEAIQRDDGSWLFDGMLQVADLKEYLDINELPGENLVRYETVSGLMMASLGRIPVSGDHFDWDHYRFEVVDMDGRRVDKVLVTRQT